MVSKRAEQTIRNYITSHPNCTKNEVVKHMNGLKDESSRISRVTTLNSINDLEYRGIIKILKPKRKGQSHHLIISEDNIFNSIDKWISETETVVTMVIKNLDTAQGIVNEQYSHDKEPIEELEELATLFTLLRDLVKTMIDLLLIEIYSKIKSTKEREILSARTLKLLLKILKYTVQPRPPLTVIEGFTIFLSSRITERIKAYARNSGMDIDEIYDLIPKIKSFEKQFIRYKHPNTGS